MAVIRPQWLDRRGPCSVCGEVAVVWDDRLGPMHVECAPLEIFAQQWREAKAQNNASV